jgi:flagellar biosynthesis anti-sigma factor FlgM
MVSEVTGPGAGSASAITKRGAKLDATAGSPEAVSKGGENSEIVTLTDLSTRLQKLVDSVADLPIVDREKVQSLQTAIANGTYDSDPATVAQKLQNLERMLANASRSE